MVAIVMGAFGVSVLATVAVRRLAHYFGVVDQPDGVRKRHRRPVALLGGLALFASFWLSVLLLVYTEQIVSVKLTALQLVSVAAASLVIIVVGILDELYDVSPKMRLAATIVAAGIPLLGGIGLDGITNPFGGILPLDYPRITLPAIGTVLMIGDVLVFLWLLGMMYTTKILDGLDGLTTGIAAIGGIMIFCLTQTDRFYQPNVGLLALAFSGVCLGFLVFNFKPASIFLGESGSLFLGFMLGILAVISGGKIATTLLVMAVPILDLARVIIVRLARGQPVMQGDREHLHFKLLDSGLSERATVILLYCIAIGFGITTLFLQSKEKLIVLGVLLLVMLGLSIFLYRRNS